MATTNKKKLYERYLSRVKPLLSSPLHGEMAEAIARGKTKVLRMSRYESSAFDTSWVEVIEDILFDLGEIIKVPRTITKEFGDIVPVELAKKTNNESVQHLASHTQYVKTVEDNGDVVPSKLLSFTNDDFLYTYENRFIATLIRRLVLFVEKRYDFIKNYIPLHKEEVMLIKTNAQIGSEEVEIETRVKSRAECDDPAAQTAAIVAERIRKMREYLLYYFASPFMHKMKNERDVRKPIIMTNILRKNVRYHKCYEVFSFIERYDSLGLNYKSTDTYGGFTDEQIKEYSLLGLGQFLAMQDDSEYETIRVKNHAYKPRILSSIDDEEFVFGPLPKGPIEFVRADEEYRKYLASKVNKNLPEHPHKAEKDFYEDDYALRKDVKAEIDAIEKLLRRKEAALARFEKAIEAVIAKRELEDALMEKWEEQERLAHEEDLLNIKRAEIFSSARGDYSKAMELRALRQELLAAEKEAARQKMLEDDGFELPPSINMPDMPPLEEPEPLDEEELEAYRAAHPLNKDNNEEESSSEPTPISPTAIMQNAVKAQEEAGEDDEWEEVAKEEFRGASGDGGTGLLDSKKLAAEKALDEGDYLEEPEESSTLQEDSSKPLSESGATQEGQFLASNEEATEQSVASGEGQSIAEGQASINGETQNGSAEQTAAFEGVAGQNAGAEGAAMATSQEGGAEGINDGLLYAGQDGIAQGASVNVVNGNAQEGQAFAAGTMVAEQQGMPSTVTSVGEAGQESVTTYAAGTAMDQSYASSGVNNAEEYAQGGNVAQGYSAGNIEGQGAGMPNQGYVPGQPQGGVIYAADGSAQEQNVYANGAPSANAGQPIAPNQQQGMPYGGSAFDANGQGADASYPGSGQGTAQGYPQGGNVVYNEGQSQGGAIYTAEGVTQGQGAYVNGAQGVNAGQPAGTNQQQGMPYNGPAYVAGQGQGAYPNGAQGTTGGQAGAPMSGQEMPFVAPIFVPVGQGQGAGTGASNDASTSANRANNNNEMIVDSTNAGPKEVNSFAPSQESGAYENRAGSAASGYREGTGQGQEFRAKQHEGAHVIGLDEEDNAFASQVHGAPIISIQGPHGEEPLYIDPEEVGLSEEELLAQERSSTGFFRPQEEEKVPSYVDDEEQLPESFFDELDLGEPEVIVQRVAVPVQGGYELPEGMDYIQMAQDGEAIPVYAMDDAQPSNGKGKARRDYNGYVAYRFGGRTYLIPKGYGLGGRPSSYKTRPSAKPVATSKPVIEEKPVSKGPSYKLSKAEAARLLGKKNSNAVYADNFEADNVATVNTPVEEKQSRVLSYKVSKEEASRLLGKKNVALEPAPSMEKDNVPSEEKVSRAPSYKVSKEEAAKLLGKKNVPASNINDDPTYNPRLMVKKNATSSKKRVLAQLDVVKDRNSGNVLASGTFLLKSSKGYYAGKGKFVDNEKSAKIYDDFDKALSNARKLGAKVVKL